MTESETGEVRACHFSLADGFGQQFTDILREMAWDDLDRNAAIVKAMTSMPDMSREQVEELLDGRKKLITAPDGASVEFVDDDWTPPTKELEQAKAEIEEMLKKVAGVGGNHDNLRSIDVQYIHTTAAAIMDYQRMNMWKAASRARGLCKLIKVLREEAELAEQKAYEENARLDKMADDLRRGTQDMMKSARVEAAVRVAESNLPDEQKVRLLRTMKGQADAMAGKVEIALDSKFECDTGWLSPDGKFYGCEIGQHIALSGLLKDKLFPDGMGDAEQTLEKHGWMKCTGAEWYETDKKPTRQQRSALNKWMAKWPNHKYHANPSLWGSD